MHDPYGIHFADSCRSCALRDASCFCAFPRPLAEKFDGIAQPMIFPANAVLFEEGQTPRGAYVLCFGRAKISITSQDGKTILLRIAERGEVLGLSAVMAHTLCEVTVETATPCQLRFIASDALLEFMHAHAGAALQCAQELSRNCQATRRELQALRETRSSAGKLARLLLSWTFRKEEHNDIRVNCTLTHEEMAQMIGASRETVTRLLCLLRKNQVIRLDGNAMVIRSRMDLEQIMLSRHIRAPQPS